MSAPAHLVPGASPHAQAADALLVVAPLVSRWVERLLAGHDPPLTPTQYLALRAIAKEESLTGSDLARRTGVSGAAVSQLLAGLGGAGLVQRTPAARDRRHHVLALSSAGRSALDSAGALLSTRMGALLDGMPHPEARALTRSLEQVEAGLAGTAPPRRPPPPRPRHPPRP